MDLDVSALLRQIEQRDEAALAVIYAQFSTPVYSLALHVLRDSALAQEVTQDTFMKLWNNPRAWDSSKGQFSSWLLTTARFTAIDRIRREIRRTGKNSELHENIADDEPDEMPQHEADQLRAQLNHLPDEQRHIIELAYFKGMKHSELAETLGLPLGTVKTRLRLGLQKLRGFLDDKP